MHWKVAIEMGRTCSSVQLYDLHRLSRYALLKKGKFSVEEVGRMKQTVLQGRYMTIGPITLLYFLELVSWQITNINVKRSPNHHHSQRLRGWWPLARYPVHYCLMVLGSSAVDDGVLISTLLWYWYFYHSRAVQLSITLRYLPLLVQIPQCWRPRTLLQK